MFIGSINCARYLKPCLNTTKIVQYCNKTNFDLKSVVNKSFDSVITDESKVKDIAANAAISAGIVTLLTKSKFSTTFCATAIQDLATETLIQSFRTAIQDPNFINSYKKYLMPDSHKFDLALDEEKTQEVLANVTLIASASNLELAYAILKLGSDFSMDGLPTDGSDSNTETLIKIVDRVAKNIKEENKIQNTIKMSNQIQQKLKDSNLLENAKKQVSGQLDTTLASAKELKNRFPSTTSLSKFWSSKE